MRCNCATSASRGTLSRISVCSDSRPAIIKGKTENDLLKLPFKAAYMFRPAGIQPLHGIKSKTAWVQAIYVVAAPLLTLLNRVTPTYMTTTEQVGRAMIRVARDGYPRPVLESEDINAVRAAGHAT